MLHWNWETTSLQSAVTGHGMFCGTGVLTKEQQPAAIHHCHLSRRTPIAIAKDRVNKISFVSIPISSSLSRSDACVEFSRTAPMDEMDYRSGQKAFGWILQTIVRPPNTSGFVVLPKRWIVERTFAWLARHRRHSKDYEHNPETSEAMIQISMVGLMTQRLARQIGFEDFFSVAL